MVDTLFQSILTSTEPVNFEIHIFLYCILASVFSGVLIAVMYTYKTKYTKSFIMTLITLPSCVAMVIMMVNGSVGTGVAVAGAFSLIRFRSVPGTAKEISAIFLAMGTGLAMGLGYIGFGIVFALVISLCNVLVSTLSWGELSPRRKTLLITMPEHLDYGTVFEDVFGEFTDSHVLVAVKTTSMGSLFKLTYDIKLKESVQEKEFIDQLRCRNGNLEISLTKQSTHSLEL